MDRDLHDDDDDYGVELTVDRDLDDLVDDDVELTVEVL